MVVFPASALARKGALEMTEAMRRLGWRLLVPGTPATDATLWRGAALEKAVRDARGRTRSTLARA